MKDRSYVQLTYMTGILPIAKYSSGSELNMFWEYTMASEAKYNEYFGFTDSEVDQLYEKYTRNTREIHISREDLKEWYDGYTTKSGERMYNPRSVVLALTNNNIGNYWTSSGPYDEINIEDCTFQNLPRVMQCMPWKNQNTATQYPMIYNHITQEEYQRIASQNKVLRGVDVPYIIVNTRYNDYNYPEKYYF